MIRLWVAVEYQVALRDMVRVGKRGKIHGWAGCIFGLSIIECQRPRSA